MTSVRAGTETIHTASPAPAAWPGLREVNAVGTVHVRDMQQDRDVIDARQVSSLLLQQILMDVLNVSVMELQTLVNQLTLAWKYLTMSQVGM